MIHRGAPSSWDFQRAEETQSQNRDADRTVAPMLVLGAAAATGLWVLRWGRCRGLGGGSLGRRFRNHGRLGSFDDGV